MSGTSADGITAALTEITGTGTEAKVKLIGYKTYVYDEELRGRVFRLFNPDKCTVQDVCEMNFVLGAAFADVANRLIKDFGVTVEDVDLIGSHGQTIWHQPHAEPVSGHSADSTLQIGEPAVISEKTGFPIVSDFRKADIAVGGEGAPLTPYLDYVLHRDQRENRILQNIGGIANLTFLPAGGGPDDVVAFDTGPGNMIIDALAKHYTGQSHDADGKLALSGKVNHMILDELLAHPYYLKKPPKTTGREVFGEQYASTVASRGEELGIKPEDLIASVTMLTIQTIINSYKSLGAPIDAVYLSGGGVQNPAIVQWLRQELKAPVYDYSVLGVPSEAKESVLMALLANEHIMGTPCNIISATGARKKVVLGYCTWV
ncbi:anhydro-N-acetylmuramic acid kinase [Candidatus Bathyarchaeota archaeon]|nr:anhydro-N-acetylmuramic acid kinase [Candidatus Bathyarchaeota archaeon]